MLLSIDNYHFSLLLIFPIIAEDFSSTENKEILIRIFVENLHIIILYELVAAAFVSKNIKEIIFTCDSNNKEIENIGGQCAPLEYSIDFN